MKLPSLRSNILSLGAVQVGNSLVPFLAIPYVTRILGAESYGQVVWVQVIMIFGAICVDFGFGWSVTRDISAHRDDARFVSRLSADVWALQWGLLVVFSIGVLVVALLFGHSTDLELYAAGLSIVIGQVLFPTWLFQGLEALRAMAVIQLLSKIISLPILFLGVEGPNDRVWVLLFWGSSAVGAGVIGIFWILRHRLVILVLPKWSGISKLLRDGVGLFLTRILVSTYTTFVPLAVGWWAGSTQLAYFNLADRLRQAVQSVLSPVSQALFPRMSWLFEHDERSARVLLYKSAILMIAISGFAGAILSLGADQWMTALGGVEFIEGSETLKWLAWVPLVVAMSNLMGIQIMLPRGMTGPFSRILALASAGSLMLLYPFIDGSGAQGGAKLVFLVEFAVTVSMGFYLWRNWWAEIKK